MPRRTRLTPAELYLRPPILEAVECPPHLMAEFSRPAPSPARRPAILQHPAAGNVVSLAAYRAAREARTSRPAGGDEW